MLFAAVKEFCKSIKVIAMVRLAPFFDSWCIYSVSTKKRPP